MALGDWLTLAVLAAVVVAIISGRRKGRARFQASMSAATASGHAAARAELAAQLTNSVIVNAGNSGQSPTVSDSSDDVLIAALRRIASGASVDRGTLDDFAALDDRRRMVDNVGQRGADLELPADWAARHQYRRVTAGGVGDGSTVTP